MANFLLQIFQPSVDFLIPAAHFGHVSVLFHLNTDHAETVQLLIAIPLEVLKLLYSLDLIVLLLLQLAQQVSVTRHWTICYGLCLFILVSRGRRIHN